MIGDFIAIITSIFVIAATGIGIQCAGDKKSSAKNFQVFVLVMAILTFLFKVGSLAMQHRAAVTTAAY